MRILNNKQLPVWLDILNESQSYKQNQINQIVDKFDSQSPWANDRFFVTTQCCFNIGRKSVILRYGIDSTDI